VSILHFTENLNHIFETLCVSNAAIAKQSGIDPSLISRYRLGDRVPTENSIQFIKLCHSIALYAEENGLSDTLKTQCRLNGNGNLQDQIITYLIPQKSRRKERQLPPPKKQKDYNFFGEKLNALMNILDVSNIRLAKTLSVDSSLISRFRNGLRIPQKNSEMMNHLCRYFYKRVLAGGFEDKFAQLLGITKQMITDDSDKLMEYFIAWLSGSTESQTIGAMDHFLSMMDSFHVSNYPQALSENILKSLNIMYHNIPKYIGINGFRCAIIRFLSTVALAKQPRTLKLYSDQRMDWLTDDPDFMQKWAALMVSVLFNKNRVQIIHNIERNLPEMLVGIEKWMPLYMTGMLEAFYCKKAGDFRFAHTLFVAPKLAAINANLVTGTEDRGNYLYSENTEDIDYLEVQFDALMELSKPLVRVFHARNITEYYFYLGEMSEQPGKTKKLLLSLSIATMPKVLLEKILIRNELESSEIERILILYDSRVHQFETELKNGGVTEYITLPSDEELFTGRVELNLSSLFLNRTITYTTEEYSEHICAILSLINEQDQYHFEPLKERPFVNIQIALKSDVGVMVLKSDDPTAGFWFGHPMMCRAFEEYIDVISDKIKLPLANKNNLVNLLSKYVT
jgi:transcriptional regulator with XRE-family HTH domain